MTSNEAMNKEIRQGHRDAKQSEMIDLQDSNRRIDRKVEVQLCTKTRSTQLKVYVLFHADEARFRASNPTFQDITIPEGDGRLVVTHLGDTQDKRSG